MNYTKDGSGDEMSMEEILSSIRKYVSEDKETVAEEMMGIDSTNDDESGAEVIRLNEHQLARDDNEPPKAKPVQENPKVYQERSTLSTGVVTEERQEKKQSPFEQLTNALNAYGKHRRENNFGSKTVDQLFSEFAEKVIHQWVNQNMEKFVEKIVMREIEKIKSE